MMDHHLTEQLRKLKLGGFTESLELRLAQAKRSYNQISCTSIKKTYPLASLKSQEPLCRGAKKGYVL